MDYKETDLVPPPDVPARAVVRWTPARFLLVGGCALIVLGLSGALGLFSSLPPSNVLNPPYWIDWVHVSVGTVAILVALKGNANIQRRLAFVPAVLGSAMGIAGLALSLHSGHGISPKPVDLSDHVTHVCVGALASWAIWNTRPRIA